jgi:uncharacterized membrane protein
MSPLRILRHWLYGARGTRAYFAAADLEQIKRAVGDAAAQHAGEIHFVIETALPFWALWHGMSPRARALEVFAHMRVWDTHANNGVLIYVLRADKAVEIVADRAISERVKQSEWDAVCREVESDYRAGRFAAGSSAAVNGVARLLGEHFPAQSGRRD